jgi:hypothetical protein
MQTSVKVEGKDATFAASARNDSGLAIRHAEWCIRADKQKIGCAFFFGTTEPWQPGTTVRTTHKCRIRVCAAFCNLETLAGGDEGFQRLH